MSVLRTTFNSLASVLAGPPPKALGMQTEGPLLLGCSKGWGPTPGNEGQDLTSVPETTAPFIPIISGDTKMNNAIFKHVASNEALNNLAVKLRRAQNIALTTFCYDIMTREAGGGSSTAALQETVTLLKAVPEPSYPSDCPNKMQQQWKQNSLN